MPDKDNVIDNILDQIAALFQHLLPLAHQELLDLDLTAAQFKVVLLLYMNEAKRMTDLARQMGITLATATGIIDQLVEKDIVARENKQGDRRVVMCKLTDKGRAITNRLWSSSQIRIRQLFEAIDLPRLILLEESLNELVTKERSLISEKQITHP